MSDTPDRIRRAFRDHSSFDSDPEPQRFRYTATPFDATVEVSTSERRDSDEPAVVFDLAVQVPMLDAVTADRVADVVEDGWYETFELRVADVGGVTRIERDVSPSVRRSIDDETRVAVVEATLEDRNVRRGLDDVGAIADYVEGTYVQGIIPGYEYEPPVADIISEAHAAGGTEEPTSSAE